MMRILSSLLIAIVLGAVKLPVERVSRPRISNCVFAAQTLISICANKSARSGLSQR